MTTPKYTNALSKSSSPYLLQHQHNPVNWVEWSDEVPLQAQKEDKLMIISIGYSSCHWCHVMEHESFENEETAAIMNQHFICVKIDREERPDIDQVYMDAIQLLTGRGGWPLNVITLPDGKPLHGGTYFPKKEWDKVLLALVNFYSSKKEEAIAFSNDLTAGIKRQDKFIFTAKTNDWKDKIEHILEKWSESFDMDYGGYRWAPKFPLPNQWEMFLQYFHLQKNPVFEQAVEKTLTEMAIGGIFDQLGGGFCRYSTDSYWKVPHFEKMLYDNGQLMALYAKAYAHFKHPLFKEVVYKIHRFVQQEMSDAEGRFYSALDADSEGIEGKYYVWSKQEIDHLLGPHAPVFNAYFSITEQGNWEPNINILHQTASSESIAQFFGLTQTELKELIDEGIEVLLEARDERIAPGLDDKVICSWNALMIKGYIAAYKHLQDEVFLHQAKESIDALLSWSVQPEGLKRIYKNGKVSIDAFAEDYAILIETLMDYFEVSGEEQYLIEARRLMEQVIEHFSDLDTGLFYFTSYQSKQYVVRKIDVNDDVIPSSNSILAKCLHKLSFYFDELDYQERAEQMLASVFAKIEKFPNAYSNWIQLFLSIEHGWQQILITGEDAKLWQQQLWQQFLPNTIVHQIPQDGQVPLFKDKQQEKGNKAFVCTNRSCGLPIEDFNILKEMLPH
jgi:uncharacterized protein YyaL (SSP411 family)